LDDDFSTSVEETRVKTTEIVEEARIHSSHPGGNTLGGGKTRHYCRTEWKNECFILETVRKITVLWAVMDLL